MAVVLLLYYFLLLYCTIIILLLLLYYYTILFSNKIFSDNLVYAETIRQLGLELKPITVVVSQPIVLY